MMPETLVEAPPRAAARTRSVPLPRAAIGFAATVVPLVGGLGLWAVSLPAIDTTHLGRYGLPPALPVSWYAALFVLVCGAVAVMWVARPNVTVMMLYVLAIVVVLFATVPAITAVPHYPWVYKHIGVTRYLDANGGIPFASGDIYTRWPGFFALAAAFSRLSGVDPLSFAAWAEPFFALVNAVMVAAIARSISRDVRVAGFAALIFTLGSWVGQAYFAPQAMAYTVAFALQLVLVRMFAGGSVSPWITRLMTWIFRREQPKLALAEPLPWKRSTGIAVVLGLDVVIVATHQLTPYVLLLQFGSLAVIGVVRPRWLIVAMGAITVGYLLPNLGFIGHNYGLFTSLNPASNLHAAASGPVHIDWLDDNAGGILSVILVLAMLASALVLTRNGEGSRALPLTILALAPFALLFAQSYGGEASLRVFLFSSPWRDILIALGVMAIPGRFTRAATALATCLVLAYLFIPAFFGSEDVNIVPADEVTASEYFYAHAPAGSVLMLSAPDFPTWVGERYELMRGPLADESPSLMETPSTFEDRPLGAAQIPIVVNVIHQYSPSGFLVFSTTEDRYAAVYGLTPPGALDDLEHAVVRSGRFRLWYSTSNARIYRLTD